MISNGIYLLFLFQNATQGAIRLGISNNIHGNNHKTLFHDQLKYGIKCFDDGLIDKFVDFSDIYINFNYHQFFNEFVEKFRNDCV